MTTRSIPVLLDPDTHSYRSGESVWQDVREAGCQSGNQMATCSYRSGQDGRERQDEECRRQLVPIVSRCSLS